MLAYVIAVAEYLEGYLEPLGPNMGHFFTYFVYKAFRMFPMSIRIIDPACSRTIFPERVALFPSEMLCFTIIRSRYRNNNSCPELNGKQAGEGFISLRSIFFWRMLVKLSLQGQLGE